MEQGKKNGITLIALIVTIIILLILAGIVINLTVGQNGILARATEAKKNYEKEAIREKVTLMMGDYISQKVEQNKVLTEYLQEKEQTNEIESIEESEDTQEGTQAVIVEGYRVVIDEETLEILEIEKAGPRPKISNIKITYFDTAEGQEKEAMSQSVLETTPLKITFDVSFEEGTLVGINKGTLENGKVQYTTNGTEMEVIFIITGKVGEEEYIKRKKVTLEEFYKDTYIADIIKVGDFVNYSVGNWTQEDIVKVGSYYEGENLPATANYFGGFKEGQSKDACINNPTTDANMTNRYSGGWRVLSINEDRTIKIVHAGTPEAYNFPRSTHNDSELRPSINIIGTYRDWTMYEDCSTNSVNTNFAVSGSAHSITTNEIMGIAQSSTIRTIGVAYHYYYVTSPGSPFYMLSSIDFLGRNKETSLGSTGIRPVVTIKANVKVKAESGQTTHDTPETAWILSLDE